ncbi:hypothetical protein B0H14DRAFT_2578803 [Mycena olivaceomarginata]|nr:hypothetical protein B0H14DRAFT_2578803 [Mycena olivaceomarginata]
MDKYYSAVRAATKLEELSTTSRENISVRGENYVQHLAQPLVDVLQLDNVSVSVQGQQIKNWRLCMSTREDDVLDEVVFRIQGIVTKNAVQHQQGTVRITDRNRSKSDKSENIQTIELDLETF